MIDNTQFHSCQHSDQVWSLIQVPGQDIFKNHSFYWPSKQIRAKRGSITAGDELWGEPMQEEEKDEGKGRCPAEGWHSSGAGGWLLGPSQEQTQGICNAQTESMPSNVSPHEQHPQWEVKGLTPARTTGAALSWAQHSPPKQKMRKGYQKASKGQHRAAQSNYSGSVKLCSKVTHKCNQQQVTCKENPGHHLPTKASHNSHTPEHVLWASASFFVFQKCH